MKLEIEHLAPYPMGENGLPIIDLYYNKKSVLFGLNCYSIEPVALFRKVVHHRRFSEIKPILRPLSDLKLTEENQNYIDLDSYKWIKVNDISEAKYGTIQYLISKHFDVFGLIEKGLAIDINSLNPRTST